MINQILGTIIAGMGLFFTGLKLVGNNLKQMTSRRFRSLVARLTDNFWLASLLGTMAGAILQSTSAITFILVSMISSGLISVRKALPIIAWCNVGCTALAFVAVLDIRLVVLYLLGLAGASFAFERPVSQKNAVGALFGIGMLFYGIELMKSGAAPLQTFPWFNSVMQSTRNSYALAFLGGCSLSFVTQSSTAVSVLAIGLVQTGVLAAEQTIMIIYGANLGSTFSRMILSSGLKGSSKQLAHFQDLLKIAGTAVFVALFYVEIWMRLPVIKALVSTLSVKIEKQMALVFLAVNLFTALAVSLLLDPLYRLLVKYFPPDITEDLSRVKYIYEQALQEPDTALDLVEKEQARLARRLPEYMEVLRAANPSRKAPKSAGYTAIHNTFSALAEEVSAFLAELVNKQLSPETSERVTNLQNRQSLIIFIEEGLHNLTFTVESAQYSEKLRSLLDRFIEGLDFVLLACIDAMESFDEGDIGLLISITADRGDLMERIRQTYLSSEEGLSYQDKSLLLHTTSVFERIVWMVQRMGQLLQNARKLAAVKA